MGPSSANLMMLLFLACFDTPPLELHCAALVHCACKLVEALPYKPQQKEWRTHLEATAYCRDELKSNANNLRCPENKSEEDG